ncbi:MAG: cob(I)yrinic acid a,c-diamide adenosyltransferase [Bacteroidales bacterium]|nr:cob(I)yrinic acid a,c-diamide adenosyltransferase [Bacteroidales bacterium]
MKNITYTKTGDKGTTSLIGGKRVPKYDDRVEAYGTVDELSAVIGVLNDLDGVSEEIRATLGVIQNKLFTLESHFALDKASEVSKMIPALDDEDVTFLERHIDAMNEELPELRAFVIPGGNLKASVSHVCRTVCRRAERQGWRLASQQEVDDLDLRYLNRLSDYFFVLARYFDFLANRDETPWNTNS